MNFETVKLDKAMYKSSQKSFSQQLEEADPSTGYDGTARGEKKTRSPT